MRPLPGFANGELEPTADKCASFFDLDEGRIEYAVAQLQGLAKELRQMR